MVNCNSRLQNVPFCGQLQNIHINRGTGPIQERDIGGANLLHNLNLENRKQYCAANGLESGAKTVTCGVPQGSYFGPLLSTTYLNDFEKCLIDSKAGLYADDTHVTVVSTNVEDLGCE